MTVFFALEVMSDWFGLVDALHRVTDPLVTLLACFATIWIVTGIYTLVALTVKAVRWASGLFRPRPLQEKNDLALLREARLLVEASHRRPRRSRRSRRPRKTQESPGDLIKRTLGKAGPVEKSLTAEQIAKEYKEGAAKEVKL